MAECVRVVARLMLADIEGKNMRVETVSGNLVGDGIRRRSK